MCLESVSGTDNESESNMLSGYKYITSTSCNFNRNEEKKFIIQIEPSQFGSRDICYIESCK